MTSCWPRPLAPNDEAPPVRSRHLAPARRLKDLRDEMELITLRAEALVREGMTPDEAEAEARRMFAIDNSTIEQLRHRPRPKPAHALLREMGCLPSGRALRGATRLREPAVTAFIIGTLALGIGINVTAFSVVDRVLCAARNTCASRNVWFACTAGSTSHQPDCERCRGCPTPRSPRCAAACERSKDGRLSSRRDDGRERSELTNAASRQSQQRLLHHARSQTDARTLLRRWRR